VEESHGLDAFFPDAQYEEASDREADSVQEKSDPADHSSGHVLRRVALDAQVSQQQTYRLFGLIGLVCILESVGLLALVGLVGMVGHAHRPRSRSLSKKAG
jgi:hypothetical protein